jgi:tetratricopeptide (TPR) repeat protein
LQQSVNTLDNKLILNSLSIVCDEDTDLCIDAERKSIRLQATPEARLFLARALELNAIFTQDEQQKHLILDEAVSMAQVAVKEQKIPNNFTLSVLAYLYELKDNHAEALKLYQRSLSAPSTQNSPNRAVLVRGVIRNASALKQNQVAMSMFPQLVSTGEASISDWEEEAYRRDEIKDFAGSATAFDQAAGLAPKDGIDWCRAVLELAVVRPYQTDEILRDGRECLKREALSRTEHIVDLDGVLSSVNSYMSTALLGRGVYKEAYNYAREATKLKPGSDTAFDALGDAAFYRPSQPRKKLLGFQMAGTPLCIFGSVQHTLRFNSGVRPSRNFETLPS